MKIGNGTIYLGKIIIVCSIVILLNDFALAQTSTNNQTVTVDTSAIDEASCWLLYFQEGAYGALLTAAAGLSAVVGAAVGSYRLALNCLIVALGSYMVRPVASVLLHDYMPDCTAVKEAVGTGTSGWYDMPHPR
jgi:hypothetical protein